MSAHKIIISGTIDLPPDKVDAALAEVRPLIEGAQAQPGCLDYDWCVDPLRPGRIRVFELWEHQDALASHFGNRWYREMLQALGRFGILRASTAKYRVDLVEPVYDDARTPRADFFTAEDT